MNIICCNYRCSCTAVAVAVSVLLGVIAAFLQLTGVIALTPVILAVAEGVAAAYLGALVLTALLSGRRDRGRDCCSALSILLAGLLGTILLAAILLAVGITATSVISAILVGLLIAFVAVSILESACLLKCLTNCTE